jgi:hypothetical protein
MNRSFPGSIGSGTQKFEQPLINVCTIDQRLTTRADTAAGTAWAIVTRRLKAIPLSCPWGGSDFWAFANS